nr:cytidylate kinase-like family protein [Desulfosarcina cetonica]
MKAIQQIIEEQVRRWEILRKEKAEAKTMPVITLSREPGSGGRPVAQAVADRLGLDLFDNKIINAMAQNADTSTRVIRTLDERGVSMIEDWVSAAISERHLWPDEVLHVLMKVVGTIGRHGGAIIVGRGANFILPPESRFRVRIIAPWSVASAGLPKPTAFPKTTPNAGCCVPSPTARPSCASISTVISVIRTTTTWS